MIEMRTTFPRKRRRPRATLLTRDDYAQIARLMVDVIRLRARVYGVALDGHPFTPYSPATAVKKRRIAPDDAPWAELQATLDKLVARLDRLPNDERKAAVRRSIGHFRQQINEQKRQYGESIVRSTKVDLTDRAAAARTGRQPMLDAFDQSATVQKARIYNTCGYARWFLRGTKAHRGPNGQTIPGMPARPFLGLSDAEVEWILRDFVQPLVDYLGLEFARLFSEGVADDVRPDPCTLFRRAWQRKPTPQDESR